MSNIIKRAKSERGAATAEYAATCGVGLGFGGLLFTLLNSGLGEKLIDGVFGKLLSILPF